MCFKWAPSNFYYKATVNKNNVLHNSGLRLESSRFCESKKIINSSFKKKRKVNPTSQWNLTLNRHDYPSPQKLILSNVRRLSLENTFLVCVSDIENHKCVIIFVQEKHGVLPARMMPFFTREILIPCQRCLQQY